MDFELDPEKLAGMTDDQLYSLLKKQANLPRHVAIIMDGNGRWAKRRFLPRLAGHRAGRHSVRRCVRACGKLGIEVLTLYTFSQENFNRPQAEVKALWHFLHETLSAEREDLNKQNVILRATGALDQLPGKARQTLQASIDALSGNTGLILNLALAYGGRQEIVSAALKLSEKIASGELKADQVTEDDFSRGMHSPELPDPDFMIRTSGEGRLSNFLLWQLAYAEILITPVLWPDFSERDLLVSVADYLTRERRFGKLTESPPVVNQSSGDGIFDSSRWKRLLKVRS